MKNEDRIIDNPEFSDAVKEGKEIWDTDMVKRAMLRGATGFTYTETTKEPKVTLDADGDKITGEMVVTKRVTKHIAPNPTSGIFWLVNHDTKSLKRGHVLIILFFDIRRSPNTLFGYIWRFVLPNPYLTISFCCYILETYKMTPSSAKEGVFDVVL